jgi:MFS family permease
MATNAGMVVLFQYSVTRLSERFHHLPVLAVGSIFYAVGVGSVALGTGFVGFLISMVILTIGEMIMIPTSTALAANLAPADMRGRYMGFYGITWGVGFGTGPVLGGLLNDHVAPVMIWYGGLIVGCMAAVGFLILIRLVPSRKVGSDSGRS